MVVVNSHIVEGRENLISMNEKNIISISEYIEILNEQLKFYVASVIGEVTEVKISSNGHIYFTLKDKNQEAVLDCVMWKGKYTLYGIKIEVGMELILSGQANIYAPWGKLSFIANSIELVGEGVLKKAYDELKQKLTVEGIFAEGEKRPLPKFPNKIGIITSKQGAVIHDFMSNLGKHGFKITFIDSRVEGKEALPDLYKALRTMKKKDVEVIVLMRGGGSLQSLAAFDTEALVREINSSPIPIIAAIGHHEDVPLCALASDAMVSTPTAATHLLNKDWENALHLAINKSQFIIFTYKDILNGTSYALTKYNQKILLTYNQIIKDIQSKITIKQALILEKFYASFNNYSLLAKQMPQYFFRINKSLKYSSENLTRNIQKIVNNMSNALAQQQTEVNTISKNKIKRSFIFSFNRFSEKIKEKEQLINVYNPMRQLALGYSLIHGSKGSLVKSIKDVTIGEILNLTTRDGIIISKVDSLKEENHG